MISNHTSNVEHYQWTLTVTADKKSTLADSGNIQLAANGTTTVARQIEIVCKAGQAEVIVGLKKPDEHIDAWMTCS
jgi:hypothetical protein